ncbi:MAG: peptidoglycan DD-metalloendopeptidase family protein [Clostridia bacterium]|nr:peptidoglycan DD-metalloendopeptidase family protein [Clostridia bacterium]
MVFFRFFTFGTGIYYNGKQIAVTSGTASYEKAIDAANTFLSSKNLDGVNFRFNTAPVLSLRTNIASGNILRDKLLLSSSKLSLGCTVYSDDTAIFTAKDKASAEEVVRKYISECSVEADAKTTTNIKFKTNIVETSSISDFEQCSLLLQNSSNVKVISVVNTTENQNIPFDTKSTEDSTLYLGESVTVTEGKEGTAQIEAQTVYQNGMPQSRRILSENILITPVSRVVRVGTKEKDVLKTGLCYPLQGVISSPYGERWGKMHEGIDIAVPEGTPVIAAECGRVIYAGDGGTYGNLVRIDHGYGVVTAYAHLGEINVQAGQSVGANTQIALSGNTGRSTGPHLHFEIVNNGIPLNPDLYLKKR